MTDTTTTWPTPQTPAPPKKPHKLLWALVILGSLAVLGIALGNGSSNTSGDGPVGVSTPASSGQVPGHCSILHEGYSACVDTQVHDELNTYYNLAEACDIESPRYLQCLNDADLASKQGH